MIQLLRRRFRIYALLTLSVLCIGAMSARADVTISDPTNGATVRGEITVRYSGVPDGGYVIVKVDGNFAQATSQSTFMLNTFDAQSFGISQSAKTDGQHQISITGVDASGANTSTATVSITVANNQVDVSAASVLLTHWVPADRLSDKAQRYRIFAESNASVSSPETASSGGGGGGGGAGDASQGGAAWIPAPLDWQYSALLRRVVRDVGLYEGSANIKTEINEAFQRQRASEAGYAGNPPVVNMGLVPVKAPWSTVWTVAPETGDYFVKAIKPDGQEINATRKKRTIAITDLLPLFPDEKVQPGSRWTTLMTFLSDLSSRKPFNVKVPMSFTGYEDIKLPSGEVRHAAKMESRFKLDQDNNSAVATKLAAALAVVGGISGGQQSTAGTDAGMGAAGVPVNGQTTGAATQADEIEAMEANISNVAIRVSRVLWFDAEKHRVLRSQDQIKTFFEINPPAQSQGAAGGAIAAGAPPGLGGTPGAAAGAAAGPTKVNYTMNVTTWYDDTIPPPSTEYNGGKGTAHSKDNVQEPSLSKATGKF